MKIKSLFNKESKTDNPRQIWVNALSKIIDPVLTNAADETLKANMPVNYVREERVKFAHLEAVGRTVCGIAPWLELGPDNTAEGKIRAKYIDLTLNHWSIYAIPIHPIILFSMNHINPSLTQPIWLRDFSGQEPSYGTISTPTARN